MAFPEQLLGNGLIVFGTMVAIVLLLARMRERHGAASSAPPARPRTARMPALRLVPAMTPAPVGVEADMAETLLTAAGATAVAAASAPGGLHPLTVGDRAALLRRISVSHVQAVHPVFRPREAVGEARPHAPAAARRPASVARRRATPARLQRAPLHLVRRPAPVPTEPLR